MTTTTGAQKKMKKLMRFFGLRRRRRHRHFMWMRQFRHTLTQAWPRLWREEVEDEAAIRQRRAYAKVCHLLPSSCFKEILMIAQLRTQHD